MYHHSEIELEKVLVNLKKNFNLKAIKSEFEAEGSSVDDISRLRNITSRNNIQLFVKIGGPEAVNDIYTCIELGVDGIIAPMIESRFALTKFKESIINLKLKKLPYLSINIETENAVKNINEILKSSENFLDNITIGRSDLAQSYFDKSVKQNSSVITNKILYLIKKIKKINLSITVGGGIDQETINKFRKIKKINLIDKLETRKIILPTDIMLKNKKALGNSLLFEEKYILYKKGINDFRLNKDIIRIQNLKTRK